MQDMLILGAAVLQCWTQKKKKIHVASASSVSKYHFFFLSNNHSVFFFIFPFLMKKNICQPCKAALANETTNLILSRILSHIIYLSLFCSDVKLSRNPSLVNY